jgi:virginiamycin A acetyltransferase
MSGSNNKKYNFGNEGVSAGIISEIMFRLYSFDRQQWRRFIRWFVLRVEKGKYYSRTIRRIFSEYHGVEVGMYTGCGNFSILIFKPGTTIGRFTTITETVRAFSGNHPLNTRSSHALFYNLQLGIVKGKEIIHRGKLNIGNDVFIGHNAILLPSVHLVGDGAYIGSGAIVTKDVPPYAIVAGNPAKILSYRYPENVIKEMLESKWWEKSLDELKMDIESFQKPLDGSEVVR